MHTHPRMHSISANSNHTPQGSFCFPPFSYLYLPSLTVRGLAPTILDTFTYRNDPLLITMFLLPLPPLSLMFAPFLPPCFHSHVSPTGGWELPSLHLCSDSLPCVDTSLTLLGCDTLSHALLHHMPSSLHLSPDPQTLLPLHRQTSWPPQAAPPRGHLLTGFRSLCSHLCGQTGHRSQEERPPS